jgi:hypothetical protein
MIASQLLRQECNVYSQKDKPLRLRLERRTQTKPKSSMFCYAPPDGESMGKAVVRYKHCTPDGVILLITSVLFLSLLQPEEHCVQILHFRIR